MTHVSVAEFRRNLPSWLDRVEAGERLVVTRRGRDVALVDAAVDRSVQASKTLEALRKTSWLGDVESPVDADWGAVDARP
jgi:prevent-host-death family protein